MYSTLSNYNNKSRIKESDQKFTCPNYIPPTTQNFGNYYNLPSSQNTNVEQLPFYKVNDFRELEEKPIVLPSVEKDTKETFTEGKPCSDEKKEESPCKTDDELLKKVRHLCKKCILLEQHLKLNHETCDDDYCMKHFLELEALSDEIARKESNTLSLPKDFQEIQQKWYVDPKKNSLECSNDLETVRKKIMKGPLFKFLEPPT